MIALRPERCVYRQVGGIEDRDRTDFAATYEGVARTESFVWVYRGEDVLNVLWRGNAEHCIQTVRSEERGMMVGIACCHPLASGAEPKVWQWVGLHALPCAPEEAVVISCLAVRPEARRNGLSMSLGYDCLRWASRQGKYTHFLLQASTDIARQPNGLVRRIGAFSAAKLQDGKEDKNPILLHYGVIRDSLAGDECGEH